MNAIVFGSLQSERFIPKNVLGVEDSQKVRLGASPIQANRREFDALESIGLDIVGKHAARSIDREKEIEAFALHILKFITPARLGETNDGQGEAEKKKSKAQNTPKTIHCSGEPREQARGREFLQTLGTPTFRVDEERNQDRDQKQSPKPLWRAETHRLVETMKR